MKARLVLRRNDGFLFSAWLLVSALSASAIAQPTFTSHDERLPNPDRPYVMTSGTVVYETPSLYDLRLRATNPMQLDYPDPTLGGYAFDSTFDVAFDAVMSFGLEPPHPVSGHGTAHARGFAPGGMEPVFVFETELVALNLVGTSPVPGGFMLRESPTQLSSGVTRVEGACYGPCPAVEREVHVSSYFDVYTELSLDGGTSWQPTRDNEVIHVVQTPEPGGAWLVLCGAAGSVFALSRKRRGL